MTLAELFCKLGSIQVSGFLPVVIPSEESEDEITKIEVIRQYQFRPSMNEPQEVYTWHKCTEAEWLGMKEKPKEYNLRWAILLS